MRLFPITILEPEDSLLREERELTDSHGAPLDFLENARYQRAKLTLQGTHVIPCGHRREEVHLEVQEVGAGSPDSASFKHTLSDSQGACSGHSYHHPTSTWSVFTAEIKKD